ncbi:MAG: YitT family protein [Chitinispirillaceae bacterium]|nr:YitT family protein [Chitinispirillaceae bacterium]
MEKRKSILRVFQNAALIQAGAVLAALALEILLVPNNIMDGGVVGVSIILSYIGNIPLGLLIFVINVPFIILSYRLLGKKFLLLTFYAVASLSVWVTVFNPVEVITRDLFLATIFGGLALGAGVGLIIRSGGCLDGTEIVAIILNRKFPFTVGEIIMFFNIFIFGTAAFVFGVDRALYSIATYIIAYKMIDLVVNGIDDSKSIFIVSEKSDEITEKILANFTSGITILKGTGGYSKMDRNIIFMIVRRLEISKIKDLVKSIDDTAFIAIQNVHEVIGKNVKRREI